MIVSALLGSVWVRAIGGVFLCLAAVWGYGAAKEWKGEMKGEARVTAAAVQKADANAQKADDVRSEVATGKRGAKNPYQRPE